MTPAPIKRIWTCSHCGRRGPWREGYSWRAQSPIQSLDSYAVTCSPKCAAEGEGGE
jgi:hypothetical protein